MALIKARNLARDFRLDPERAFSDLREAVELGQEKKPGGVRLSDFSIRDLFEELVTTKEPDSRFGNIVGHQFLKEYANPNFGGNFQEAFTAVDSTVFNMVTEQLLIREVLEAYRNPAFVLTALVPSVPTPFVDGEIIPGMHLPSNPENDREDLLEVGELEEYKVLGFGMEYIQMPATTKRGLVIALSREMIFRDRTGLAQRRAAYVGTVLGLSKERRITDVVIGGVNNYQERRKNDTALTARRTYYGIGDTSPPWINHLDANGIVDYTDIDNLDNMFSDMDDPNTGEPIVMGGRYLLYMPPKRSTIDRVINSTESRYIASDITTIAPNPLRGRGLIPITSEWAYRRVIAKLGVAAADARDYYIYGDIPGAFEYLENWPIEVSRQAAGADAEFWQDIVTAYKASERGVAAVREPRMVIRGRAVASSSSGA